MSAAKVLIIDDQNNYLMMTRAGHPYFGDDPDLPGGTIDNNDSHEDTAVREVLEEAGIAISKDNLELLYKGPDYSSGRNEISLYSVHIGPRPEVVISWEHSMYEWVSRDVLLEASKGANDTYMHMVYDVVSKLQR